MESVASLSIPCLTLHHPHPPFCPTLHAPFDLPHSPISITPLPHSPSPLCPTLRPPSISISLTTPFCLTLHPLPHSPSPCFTLHPLLAPASLSTPFCPTPLPHSPSSLCPLLDVLYAIHQLTSTFVTYIFKITSLTFLFFRRVFDIMLLSHHRV